MCSIIPLAISLSFFLVSLGMLNTMGTYNDSFLNADIYEVNPYDQCNNLVKTLTTDDVASLDAITDALTGGNNQIF